MLALLFLGCKKAPAEQPATKAAIPATPAKNNSTAQVSTDSIIEYMPPEPMPVPDSIFIVKGLPFEVNSIKCYWEYRVKKAPPLQNKPQVVILYQKLKGIPSGKTIFETANEVDNNNYFNLYHSLNGLTGYAEFNLNCTDLNADGYCDYTIVTERAATGANTSEDAFLFNPANKQFERSEVFSGTNIQYDKAKNRISSMWKMSVSNYTFSYINLKKNKKDIAFTEVIHQDSDTITYTKSIGKKIVKRKRIVLTNDSEQDDIGGFGYLLERR
jgi:hypothetical protein